MAIKEIINLRSDKMNEIEILKFFGGIQKKIITIEVRKCKFCGKTVKDHLGGLASHIYSCKKSQTLYKKLMESLNEKSW